jgi:AraC family transcriptional regulator of adaptative response/methylated-DNA-[protein]-cysteine methyltransferase
LLVDGASVLDAALETGLSGPSRLHDIFIAEEAATPGEVKTGGSGLDFSYGFAPSPFGIAVFLIAPRGLSGLAFCNRGEEDEAAFDDLARRFPEARFLRDDAQRGTGRAGCLTPLPVKRACRWRSMARRSAGRSGGPCWRYPPARTVSYGDIARATGRDKAARAAGAAVGANPISWLDPLSPGSGGRWPVDRVPLGTRS